MQKILFEMQQGQSRVLVIDNEGTLRLDTKLCVPDVDGMRKRRLWKYISNPSHVLQPQAMKLSEDLTYEEYPVAIVDRQICQLSTKEIPMVKVLWSNHTVEDCKWETEVVMWDAYPYLFA